MTIVNKHSDAGMVVWLNAVGQMNILLTVPEKVVLVCLKGGQLLEAIQQE